MKKTLFVGLLAAAIMAISFTGCKNGPDLGTAPQLTDFFITNNNATVNSTTVSSLTRITSVTVYPNGTDEDNATQKYKEVLCYNDPDKDIVKVEFSFNNFNTIIKDDITQDYLNEILSYQNQYYIESQIPNSTVTYSVRVIDSKGNVSNTKSITLSKQ